MKGSLTRGFCARFVLFGLTFGQQFLLVPAYLHAWGAGVYQDWLVIGAVAAMAGLLDLGMQFYFGNRLTMQWAAREEAAYAKTLKIALGCYTVVTASAVAGIGALLLLTDPVALLKLGTMAPDDAFLALAGCTLVNILAVGTGILGVLYRTRGCYERSVYMGILHSLYTVLATLVCLLLGAGPSQIALVTLGGVVLILVVLPWDLRRQFGSLPWGLALPDRAELRDMAGRGGLYAVGPLYQMSVTQLPILVLNHLAPAGNAVILFSIARTLAGMVRQLPAQLAPGIGVEMSIKYAREDLAGVRSMFLRTSRFLGGVAGFSAGVSLAAAEPFVRIWTGGAVALDLPVFAVLLAGILAVSPAIPSRTFLSFTNRPQALTLSYLLHAGLSLLLMLLLIPGQGAIGAAVALAVGETVAIGLFLPALCHSRLGLPLFAFLAESGLRIAGTALVSWGLAGAAGALVAPVSPLTLGLFGALWLAGAVPAAYRMVLSADQRDWLRQGARHRLARFAGGRIGRAGRSQPQPAGDRAEKAAAEVRSPDGCRDEAAAQPPSQVG